MSNDALELKIDALYALKKDITEWNAMVTELKDEAKECEEEITEMMSVAGLKKAGTDTAQISISKQIVPAVDADHWQEVRRWIMENEYDQLFPRSLNQAAYRELINMGIEVPHVDQFEKVKISVTKSK
jgi:hypothetical protein